MGNPDLELLRLEGELQYARHRLGWITRLVPDASVLSVAIALDAEASAAVDAYRATHQGPQKT